ncbi:MAG: SHOCT domain-containing protein [Candidatus Bathyarchaeota archaeon]|nr:SHOCT domain-containing protein [Candidatus Bathyarchaeota archaeon]
MMFGPMWLFWIFIIVGLVFLIKWGFQQNRDNEVKIEENALEILKRRYVKGEIDKEEFERRRKDLLY